VNAMIQLVEPYDSGSLGEINLPETMNYFKQLVIKGNLNASEVLSDLSN
jgi:hypothetical protein